MKKSIQLHIPEPCHENWQQMTPQDQGRFCNACAKAVVDFSVMSDKEILNYISNASSKMCGRLDQDQLNRDIVYPEFQKRNWKKYWLTIAASFVLLTSKLSAQIKPSKGTVTANPSSFKNIKGKVAVTMGIIAAPIPKAPDATIIKGRVVDDQNAPIAGASVFIKGTGIGTAADVNGEFVLKASGMKPNILLFTAVGFERTELFLDSKTVSDSVFVVQMKMRQMVSGEVGVIVVTQKKKKSIFNILKKTEPKCSKENINQSIKIYPNPISTGSTFNISMPGVLSGKYSIIIYDINGKVISQNDLNENKGSSIIESFQCDSRFHSGVYVAKIVGEGKVYTQQFVVQ
jgi:CarboxypepD_reg-like domain/Secretion system C-terminal sorting domain